MNGSAVDGRAAAAGPLPGAQQVAVRAASFGILAVLLALAACALWGAAATYRADIAVKRATEASNAIEVIRKNISAERLVRRTAGASPGTAARAQHHDTAETTTAALSRAHMFTDSVDRRLVEDLQARFREYLDTAGAAWGEGAQEPLPSRVVDPSRGDPARADATLADLAATGDQLSERFRVGALNLQQALVTIQMRVLIAGPVLFGFGLLLVGAIWRAQRAEQRRGTAQLVQTAYDSGRDERRFRGVVQNAPDLVLICAGPGSVAYCNAAALTKWSYDEEQLTGQSILMLAHPDDRPALRAWWEQLAPASPGTPPDTLDLRLQDGAGQWRRVEMVGTNLLEEVTVKGVVLTIRDVGRRREAEQARTTQGLLDPVTRLPNGALLRDRLSQALVRSGRGREAVGVLAVAIEDLGSADERHGSGSAEVVALEAATRLKACVRPQDTVGRLDAATFVVVGDVSDPVALAERIVTQLSRPVRLGTIETPLAVRIGIAVGGARGGSADDLLRDAGLALQRVRPGPQRFAMFDSGARSAMLDRVELQGDLQGAVEALRRGDPPEFRVYYQPIVALASGRTCGFEALIRWQHPVNGLVSPAEFIPLAETTGLIVPLGQWVLEKACHQLTAWQDRFQADPPLTLSVNLSLLQFQQARLVTDVRRAVRAAGLGAGCLRLEITEGTIMRDPDLAVRTLWALKELGVQLAIDDYGSGYSALPYLKQLPLGMLKIDGALTAGIGRDEEDTSIVHAVVSLAKSLGWGVTAEGIETAAQAAQLREWGCDYGQGYYFGHPADGPVTQELLGSADTLEPADIVRAPA